MNDEQIKELWLHVTGFDADAYGDEADVIRFARALLADGGKGQAVDDLLTDYIELNMSNYDEHDVDRLNDWAIRAYGVLTAPQAECAPRALTIAGSHINNLSSGATNLEQIANAGERVFSPTVLANLRDIALCVREAIAAIEQAVNKGAGE